eukprot:1755497-Pyramimonas_sp.AAC.1
MGVTKCSRSAPWSYVSQECTRLAPLGNARRSHRFMLALDSDRVVVQASDTRLEQASEIGSRLGASREG